MSQSLIAFSRAAIKQRECSFDLMPTLTQTYSKQHLKHFFLRLPIKREAVQDPMPKIKQKQKDFSSQNLLVRLILRATLTQPKSFCFGALLVHGSRKLITEKMVLIFK